MVAPDIFPLRSKMQGNSNVNDLLFINSRGLPQRIRAFMLIS